MKEYKYVSQIPLKPFLSNSSSSYLSFEKSFLQCPPCLPIYYHFMLIKHITFNVPKTRVSSVLSLEGFFFLCSLSPVVLGPPTRPLKVWRATSSRLLLSPVLPWEPVTPLRTPTGLH